MLDMIFKKDLNKHKVRRALAIYNKDFSLLFKACIVKLYLTYDIDTNVVISADIFKVSKSTFKELVKKLVENELAIIIEPSKNKRVKSYIIELKEIK